MLSPFKKEVSTQRAKYLETKVEDLVNRRFSDSSVTRNLKWSEAGTIYETDLLVTLDSFALIIECKSGNLSPSALRGAPLSLKKEVRKLVIEPNQQSMRLKNRIESLRSQPNSNDPFSNEFNLDLSNVRRVVRVSVCLEDFGPIQSSLNQLKETGWLPEDFIPVPTMSLADFEVVFDILEHPVQILHYLMKRELIDSSVNYLGHEIDLLGFYLRTWLDLSDFQPSGFYSIKQLAVDLDLYYASLDAGVASEKPKLLISPLFDSIFNLLEQQGCDRWTEARVALSMFSPKDQDRVSRQLENLKRNVHKNWKTLGHQNTMIRVSTTPSSYALGYAMFKNGNADELRSLIEKVRQEALASYDVQTVIVIAKNIDQDDVAYDALELFERER